MISEIHRLSGSSIVLALLISCGGDADPGSDVQASLAHGIALQSSGDFASAIFKYDALLAVDAQHAGALYNRGLCALELGDAPSALRNLTRALEIEPADYDALLWRAFAHELNDDVEAALADYDAAAPLAPDDPQSYERRGELLASIGEDEAAEAEAALAAITRRLTRRPDDAEARFRRGLALLLIGDAELAERDLARATELDPESAEACLAHGHALELIGESRRALDAYSAVIDGSSSGVELLASARLARTDLYLKTAAWSEALDDGAALLADARLDEIPGGRMMKARARARLARVRATCPEEALRDEDAAVALATEALEAHDAVNGESAVPGDRWYFLDTKALALATAGRPQQAIDLQAVAVESAPAPVRDSLRGLLALYREAR